MTKPSSPRAARSSSSTKAATKSKKSSKAAGAKKPVPKKPATGSSRKRAKAPPKDRVRIIAVANQKGGVGKSTTAVSLGAALAELGHKVLVVDLDPQGNASTGMGIRHDSRHNTIYQVLAEDAPIEGAIVQTPVPNLFAIPSTIDLAGAEIELVSQFSREMKLRKALEPLKHDGYGFVFLDCPPSLGLLTINALAAAEELLVPIQCEYYALEGLGQLLRNVKLVQQNVNTGLRLAGIVMTMFDPRTKLSEQVVAEVRRYFGDGVYETIIPRTVRLSEAPGFGQPITVYDPGSKGAQRYRDLAREVADRLPDERYLPAIEELPSVVVPPPEPEPARAPRPLVSGDEGEEVGEEEPEVQAEPEMPPSAAPTPIPALTEAEVQDQPDVPEGWTEGLLGDETEPTGSALPVDDASSPSEEELEPEHGQGSEEPSAVDRWVEELEAQAALEAESQPAAVAAWREPSLDQDGQAEAEAESGHLIVVDEREGEPEEAPSEGGQPEAEGERRGWRSLLRRGGS